MNNMKEKVNQFKCIASNDDLSDEDATKFLKWGKGDMQQALNYYYNQLEKGKFKAKAKIQQKKSEEFQNSQRSSSCLDKLLDGSKKHQKIEKFIKQVRQKYELPIQGRSQREILESSKPKIRDPDCLQVDLISNLLSKDIDIESLPKGNEIQEENQFDFEVFDFHQVYPRKSIPEEKVEEFQKKDHTKNKNHSKTKLKLVSDSEISFPISQKVQMQLPENQMQVINISDDQDEFEEGSKVKNSQKIFKEQKAQFLEQNYPFKEKLQEQEIFVGECLIQSFCTIKRKLDDLNTGQKIEIKTYIEAEKKTKKKNFGKKVPRTMTMHICINNSEIGRIKDQEVRIILPLIDEGIIRMEFYVCNFPLYATEFKQILLKSKVFLKRKAITQPIVENFQPNEKDKDRVHEISALLTKLNLSIKTAPLVKGKSQYITKKQPKKQESIDIFQFSKNDKAREDMDKKLQTERIRSKTDWNYKPVQKSMVEILGQMSKEKSSNKKDLENQSTLEKSQVKKKIIQIDTRQQRDKFSELIDLHDENVQSAKPSSSFISDLYPYQSLALGWMLKREGFSKENSENQQIHPLWTQYELDHCDKYRLFFNELTGQLSVKRPLSKVKCKGGILADEMGLGKTVMMASLIATHGPPSQIKKNQGKNLIILPLTLLSQWESEIQNHTKGLKTLIYYSSERKKYEKNLQNYDVVLTTYGTVSNEFSKGAHINKTGVYRYSWFRIILDEAHYIKGRIIQTSKAVYQLKGENRWCLTGTPIQNNVGDLFSLIHFIKYTPWSEIACWNRFLAKPLEDGDKGVYGILRTLLKKIFLRRTKSSKDQNGKSIIDLPPRISKVELLTLSDSQRQFYDTVYKANQLEINSLIDRGVLEAKYMQVFQMLMRLRQICCHPILFKSVANFVNDEEFQSKLRKFVEKSENRDKNTQMLDQEQYFEPIINNDEEIRVRVGNENEKVSELFLKETMKKIKEKQLDCCLICLNDPEDPVITSCLHIFCKSCAIRQIEETGFCASCRKIIKKQDYLHLPRENRLNIKSQKEIFPSTKMNAFLQHLKELEKQDKVVVFSQFLGMLDLLEELLKTSKIKYVRMEGSNTHRERTRIVKSFQEDPNVQIFLVSLKTAGVGLNLVAANKVFMMDPWWNPAVEEQAIQRVHRIGQKRQVEITRFIIERSIEMRMLELNTEKKLLSQNVLTTSNEDQGTGMTAKVEKLRYMMENY